jgi:hypothetical protein
MENDELKNREWRIGELSMENREWRIENGE